MIRLLSVCAAMCLLTTAVSAQIQNDSLEQVYTQVAVQRGLDSVDIPGFVHHHTHPTTATPASFRYGSDQQSAPLFVGNPGFESGNFASWNGMIGENQVSSFGPMVNQQSGIFTGALNPAQTDYNARHSIMSTAGGNDPEGGFPVCPSGYGTYTARLGNSYGGYQGQSIEQSWIVSPNDSFFCVSYAVVIWRATHNPGESSYFTYEITDSAGNQIFYRYDRADSLPTGYLPGVTGEVFYLPWQIDTFDLSAYNGAELNLRLTVAGCIWSGHYAYCYVDVDPNGSSTIGMNEYSSAAATVYPNPSVSGVFTLVFEDENAPVAPIIFDASGKEINAPVTRTGAVWQIDLSAFAPGLYSFYVETSQGPARGQLIR